MTILYIFNQKIHLATIFTYTVQYPEVHHRTGLSTSVLNQFRAVHGSLLDTVGNYYNIFLLYGDEFFNWLKKLQSIRSRRYKYYHLYIIFLFFFCVFILYNFFGCSFLPFLVFLFTCASCLMILFFNFAYCF